ncbi:hypothetical protein KSP40_PGU000955 [Platanthera guangdongensis]|uniref:Phytocyanin domain-containing protein n=1 Tax=Platanthera guangdongensis TaxID=2320717 RepID=A0ABR2MFY2_9ASPA
MAAKLPFFIAMAVLSAIAVQGETDFQVGDHSGWNLGVNYTTWAEGKQFKVGDTLVFRYDPRYHDVLAVGGADFKSCNTSANGMSRTSGKDVVTLTAPGRKWYICTKGKHCESGMKLFIDVVAQTEAPAPSPTGGEGNSANAISSTYLAAVVIAFLAMVVMQ